MLYEIEKVIEFHQAFIRPVRDVPDEEVNVDELRLRQKLIREETDELKIALIQQNLVEVADGLADTAYVVAGTCAQLGTYPDINSFIKASQELLEISRKTLIDGIRFKRWDQVRVGAGMIHTVLLGMAFALNIPYHIIFDAVHKNNMSKLGPDGKPIMRADGKVLKPDNYVPVTVEIKNILISFGVMNEEEVKEPLKEESKIILAK